MKADFHRRLDRIVSAIKQYHPTKIVLFGSRARGDAKPNSDIDIAVDGHFSFRQRRKLKESADEAGGLYSVDIVFYDRIEEHLLHNIEQEGKVLYEKE